MNTLTGYSKSTLTDSYLLTAAGGHKAISDFVTLSGNLTISGVKTFSTQLKFTASQGTSPFTVTSTTKIDNLNADYLDGIDSTGFFKVIHLSNSSSKLLSNHINSGGASNKGDDSTQTECPTPYGAWISIGGNASNNTALLIYGDSHYSNTKQTLYYRTRQAGTSKTSYREWVTLLDSNNSSVTTSGSGWGSSITVTLNGSAKTLTIPDAPTIPSLSLGTTTGSGNAVTSISVDGHKITLNKGTTFSVSDHTHSHLVSGASLSGSDHAVALKNYFNNNKASIPRCSLNTYYSSAMSNGSLYFGYFLNAYNDTPYGGFYVAHYDTPYYVGISYGTFTQHLLAKITDITKSQVGLSNVQNTAFYTRATMVNGVNWSMAGPVNGDAFTIYAPTTGGTANYILKSNKDAAPTWIALSDISAGKLGGYEESKFLRSKGWVSAGSINDFSQGIYGTDTKTTDVPKDANGNNLTYSTVLSFDALVGSGYGKVLFYVKSALLYYRHYWDSKWYDWYLIALKTKATSSALGLVKIGYTTSGKNYAVLLNSDGLMYVNVPWTDTQVTNTLATTTKFYLTGTNSSSTNTGTQYFDTNIYTDTEAGNLYALKMNAGSFRSSGHSILGYNSGSGWTGGENLSSVIVGTVGLPLVIRSSGNNLYHYHSANSTRYLICDTNNTSYTATLTSGTAIGTLKIGETSHTLYCSSRGYIGTTSVLDSSAALKLKGINGLYLSEDSSSAINNKGVNFCNSAGNIKHSIGATSNGPGFGIYSSGTLYLRAGCNASTSVDTALTSSNTGLVLDASGNLTVSGTISASNFSGVGNGKITIKLNNTEVGSFTMNQSSAGTINLTDTTYSLVGANGTTGLIKNGSTITNTTGLTACPIINGVPYYRGLSHTNVTYGTYPSEQSDNRIINIPEFTVDVEGRLLGADTSQYLLVTGLYLGSSKTVYNSDLKVLNWITLAPGITMTLQTPTSSELGKIIFVKSNSSTAYVKGHLLASNTYAPNNNTFNQLTISIERGPFILVCMQLSIPSSQIAWVIYYCG